MEKIKIWYEFDSDYAEEKYAKFEGREFEYEIELEDAKDTLIWDYLKRSGNDHISTTPIIEVINMMDNEGIINWMSIIYDEDNMCILEEYYKYDAMKKFTEDNYFMTKEEYKSEMADRYNDERWCGEHE